MNLPEISDFVDEIQERHNVPKRIAEIDTILDSFKRNYLSDYEIDLIFMDNAAIIIAHFYFYLLEKNVKGYLEDNSNIFKMASGTELVMNYVQPIVSASPQNKILRRLNAELSAFAAIGFMAGWNNIDYYLGSGIETLNDSIDTVLNERIKILENQDLENSFPMLFNSQTWELFHLLSQYFRSAAMMR